MTHDELRKFMKTLSNFMVGSMILWIMIIVMQFFIGLFTIFAGYGFVTWMIMVYNIVGCVSYSKAIKMVRNTSSRGELLAVISYFEKSFTTSIIFAGINLVLGGVVGVIGCIYDAIICYFVKKKKDWLLTYNPPVSRPVEPISEPEEWDGEYKEEHRIYY